MDTIANTLYINKLGYAKIYQDYFVSSQSLVIYGKHSIHISYTSAQT